MVDVGCGVGTWLAEFVRGGVVDVLGVDGAHVDPAMLQIPRERFRAHDLTRPLELGRRFDLAVSVEVAEHLPEAAADAFVASLVAAAPVVVFSAAIPGQGGEGHVNESWPHAWARRFAAHGHRWADPLRASLWNDPRVEFWYAQNLLVFHAPDAFPSPPWPPGTPAGDAASLERSPLSLVHPSLLAIYVKRRPTFKRAWREWRRSMKRRLAGGG